ncbi:hypothetical protein K7W41_10150, partial [Deinococcus multiflagellatus]|nr:hypothetical protein [Deinococcus multiflagellatus]
MTPLPTVAEALTRRLRQTLSLRRGLAAALCGEAGIGKSHAAHSALLALGGRSLSVHATLPPGALLSRLPGGAALPAWAQQARAAAPHDTALLDAVGAALAQSAPFVLYAEDLHEASAPAQAWWSALARAAPQLPGVGVVISTRGEAPPGFEPWPLRPLDPVALDDLLRVAAGAPLPAEAAGWIGAVSGGNPLFALEYFRTLARAGSLWSDGRVWRWHPPQRGLRPAAVDAILDSTLGDLDHDPAALAALDLLALWPGEGPQARLGALCGLSDAELAPALQRLQRQGVLRGVAFTHPLYCERHRARAPGRRLQAAAR